MQQLQDVELVFIPCDFSLVQSRIVNVCRIGIDLMRVYRLKQSAEMGEEYNACTIDVLTRCDMGSTAAAPLFSTVTYSRYP